MLLGLTGRGTYQLARILQGDQPQQTVPEWEEGESHPPILLMLYRLVLESDDENQDFAAKKVVNYSAVQSPVLLRFTNGKWRFPDTFGQSQ